MYAAGNNELDRAVQPAFLQGDARFAHRGQGRNPGMVKQDVRRGTRAALHPIDHNYVGSRLGRQLHIVVHASRAHFDKNRHLPVGCLAQLLDFCQHIVRAEPVRMTARAALVNTWGQVAQLGDFVRDLGLKQQPARAGLGSLSHRQLNRVGLPQMVHVDTVAAG